METLIKLLNSDNIAENSHHIYNQLSLLNVNDVSEDDYSDVLPEEILTKIYLLINKKELRNDLVYFALLSTGNLSLLRIFIEYERQNLKVDLNDTSTLYNYSILTNKHWFYELLESYDEYELPKSIFNKIALVKVISLIEEGQSISVIQKLLSNVDCGSFDEFWKKFIEGMFNLLDIAKVCSSNKQLNMSDFFNVYNKNSLLSTFSYYIELNNPNVWETILSKLEDYDNVEENHKKLSIKESDSFKAFTILSSILNFIQNCKKGIDSNNSQMNNSLDKIKKAFLDLNNNRLLIDLLEETFAIIFIQTRHTTLDDGESFMCQENEIRSILHLLESVMTEGNIQTMFGRNTENNKRFLQLRKFMCDALWRLDLVTNVRMDKKRQSNFINFMLAPPTSLIRMCIKRSDFSRAYQVIEIFGMHDSSTHKEIKYTEKFHTFKNDFKQLVKIRDLQQKNPNITYDISPKHPTESLKTFINENEIYVNESNENLIQQSMKFLSYLEHYQCKNEKCMNIFDFMLTQDMCIEDFDLLQKLLHDCFSFNNRISSSYLIFYNKLLEVCNVLKVTPSKVLLNCDIPFNVSDYHKQEHFYNQLQNLYEEFNENLETESEGVLNMNHSSHKTFLKLNNLCYNYMFGNIDKNQSNYFLKFFNYLKGFSKVFYIQQNSSNLVSQGKNTSYFELLQYNRSELMGKLLFEYHLDPSEFEIFFNKMKLDYLYHVVGNCFPTINLHTEEFVSEEELYPEHKLYIPSKAIISYIQKRNWLLAFILTEMHEIKDIKIDISESRLQTFLNYKNLPKIGQLKPIFQNNEIITSLQNEISLQKIKAYFQKNILKNDELLTSQVSNISDNSFEAAEEILEDVFRSTNWKELYDILQQVPEIQYKKCNELYEICDMVLNNIVTDCFEFEYYTYVQHISDNDLRQGIVLANFSNWPSKFCIDVLKAELSKFSSASHNKKEELKMWLDRIILCDMLAGILGLTEWNSCLNMINNHLQEAFEKILLCGTVDILIRFINFFKPGEELLTKIDEKFILEVFKFDNCYDNLNLLLNSLPFEHTVNVCYKLLKQLKDVGHLEFLTNYLKNNLKEPKLKNICISLKILSYFMQNEQDQLLCLLDEPMDIIEVLIMNTKLEKLSTVLDGLKSSKMIDDKTFFERLDRMLRSYAEKSLDFRVITQPNPRLLRTPEHKLMQSFDSLNLGSDQKNFIMPDYVPSKEEWIQNNDVLECLCCQRSTFSMFNRRHHCRRCGRVVCYACSSKRMIVPTYGDILVRVCDDCYEQTFGSSLSLEHSDSASIKSALYDYWLLTDDSEHNKIVREEFSYEYAPSVSLCLNLLKYHSKNVDYPKFLLEQCDIVLKLLLPSQEPIQEIDYFLVIKMLRSLAVAAKMLSNECAWHQGTSIADRILSQAELLNLLAERGCLMLLPISSSNAQGHYIDAGILRRLRDKLLEREQWTLALEVSTKAGLENTGVFAAWGKSCLKAGALLLAREKFHRCFEKNVPYDLPTDSISSVELSETLEVPHRPRNLSRMSGSMQLDNKPAKNPPLLNEIIHILELKTTMIDSKIVEDLHMSKLSNSTMSLNQSSSFALQSEAAISILNKMKNLDSVANGVYYLPVKNSIRNDSIIPRIDPIFYDECIYYLSKYGSHTSLLEFYVKHGEINKALIYLLDNRMNFDYFTEIYMKCLKDGIVNILQENMSKIDSTLDIWKDYLRHICWHLEKHNLLHSLHQLQQFMGDYIRAAMTCIRFYHEHNNTFSDLVARVRYLYKAEEHLKQVCEQDEWVEVATVRKMSSSSRESFEAKSITNTSLVMKMDLRSVEKHINTIHAQIEVARFLSECESNGLTPVNNLETVLPLDDTTSYKTAQIPTLFGSTKDKISLVVLIIINSSSVQDGFEFANKIIENFKLKRAAVYCQAGKQFAKNDKFDEIAELVSCIKSSSENDKALSDMCDEMLSLSAATLSKANAPSSKVENLIKLISDKATKISAFIEAKQLKSAYFYAVRYKRITDIRRIQREAELNNQPNIKALCQRVLQSHTSNPFVHP